MGKYCVEYLSMIGRTRVVHVMGESIEDAVDAAVKATGCNFSDIKSVKQLANTKG